MPARGASCSYGCTREALRMASVRSVKGVQVATGVQTQVLQAHTWQEAQQLRPHLEEADVASYPVLFPPAAKHAQQLLHSWWRPLGLAAGVHLQGSAAVRCTAGDAKADALIRQ